ncbi:MAG: CHASE2 domain-containing protein [Verrucomicrobiota bacterium]
MRRQKILLMLVILLLGALFSREPRLQRTEEIFLHWLIRNSTTQNKPVPLTIVELGGKTAARQEDALDATEKFLRGSGRTNSPLEFALLIQALMEFKPTVVALTPVLQWPESSKDEQQVLVDQAMRMPKLLLASELTATPDPDAPVIEMPVFSNATSKHGDLMAFSGIARQPAEDMRLISTAGALSPSREIGSDLHAPLLFQYRGDVIPSFALQAAMLWLRLTPGEMKVDIGNSISLPDGKKIPLRRDGTVLINPNAARGARRISLNALLLAAQQHERKLPTAIRLDDLSNQIVLVQTTNNPWETPDVLAATIASIQTNSFVHRVSWIFDCIVLVIVVALSGWLQRFSRIDLLLGAIAFSAAYAMIALTLFSRWNIWLPGFLPLGAVWAVVVFSLLLQKPKNSARTVAVAPSPPVP